MKKNKRALGRCYETALHLVLESKNPDVILVHGVVRQTKAPFVLMGHAWTEEFHGGEWFVRDGLFPTKLWPRIVYYAIGHVSKSLCIRYTRTDAMVAALRTKNYGPWHGVPEGVAFAP